MSAKERHLITSALPYINGAKHLGNLIGSMLPADVFARFLRQCGHDVLYICATDEHGTPAEIAALKAGIPVDKYCRWEHERQKLVGERFLLSWDYFGRSSSDENRELTQHLATRLDLNGHLKVCTTQQFYSPSEQRYLPDRYITGTCPRCEYARARGDQCEACGALLDPMDLVEPRSTITGARDLEVRSAKHLFLKQSTFELQLRAWIDSKFDWPALTTSIAKKWLNDGLQDRCITRDLTWGVPVNKPGFENKVYYVWFDAPIEYIGATYEWARRGPAEEGRDWKSWWYDATDVFYTQFMAKDNIPFHTLSFPCTLLGSGEPWKLADYIKGFNWLTYYGGKFSTSDGVGVFMDDAIELLPADYWRWFLIANAPESNDANFTWSAFGEAVNSDLADKLGNFVNRTLTFVARHFGGRVPEGGNAEAPEQELLTQLNRSTTTYTENLRGLEFRKAAQQLRRIWSLGNQYLEARSPWTSIKSKEVEAAVTMRTAVNLISLVGRLSAPIIPGVAATIRECVGTPDDGWPLDVAAEMRQLKGGEYLTVPDILFVKVPPESIAEWEVRFGKRY